MSKDELRKKILKLTKEYFQLNFRESGFKAGEDSVKYAGRVFDENELIYLVDSSLDFWLTAGRFAKKFENLFANYHNMKYCALTNSGSSANLLALASLTSYKLGERRLKPGDEVITVAAGFPTTIAPIIQYNLKPVFIDIDINTLNVDYEKIEDSITDRTKAIFLAHTLGNPFNIEKILEIKRKYNLWLIEDVCDALGAKWKNKLVGTFGDISTYSFYPAHHITMGEGGALITDNTQLYRNIKSFRDWGRDCWCEPGHNNTCGKRYSMQLGDLPKGYDHKFTYSHLGYNLKITDMQAAVGVAQFEKLPEFIRKRNENFEKYLNFFKQYSDYFILPKSYDKSEPSWFGFPVTVKNKSPFSRTEFADFLSKKKIDTRMLFAGNMIKQPALSNIEYKVPFDLDNTNQAMESTIWFGVYPGLSQKQLNYIFDTITNFIKNAKKDDLKR